MKQIFAEMFELQKSYIVNIISSNQKIASENYNKLFEKLETVSSKLEEVTGKYNELKRECDGIKESLEVSQAISECKLSKMEDTQ